MNIFIATIKNGIATLTPGESWHCAKVLRNRVGDRISLIDGNGNFYEGVLTLVSEKNCCANITSGPTEQKKREYFLHLAIAPTKHLDRIEWMIEKAVEIGIDELSFIQCKNSERTSLKSERILKIVESAVKQSLQAFIPKVNGLITFGDAVSMNFEGQKLIAHCHASEKIPLKQIEFKNQSTLVLIGPEGDFTREEVNVAMKDNFKAISLGSNRLRTETAGLYICQAASILS